MISNYLKKSFIIAFLFLFCLGVKASILDESEAYLKKLKNLTFLKNRKSSLERPKQCAYEKDLKEEAKISGKKVQNLLDQFEEVTKLLKKEECSKAGKSIFIKIEKDLSDMREAQEKFMKDTKMATAKKGLTDFSGAKWDPVLGNKVLDNWGKLTKVPECGPRFKKREILGKITNFTTNILFTGMLIPGRIGQVSSYYALALGSTMKLFKLILDSINDYVDPIQREAYLKMNCAFFEYEYILDIEGFFSIHSTLQKKEIYKIVHDYLPTLENYIKKIKEPMKKHQEEFFIKNYGEVNFNIFGYFEKVKPIVKTFGRFAKRPQDRGPLIKTVWKSFEYIALQKSWEKAKLSYDIKSSFPYFMIVFKNHFEKYKSEKQFVGEMIRNDKEWNRILDFYFDGLDPLVDHYNEMGKKSLEAFKKTREYVTLKKIESYRDVFHHRTKVLDNIVAGNFGFSDQDAGRTDRLRIVDEYKKFEKQIYGKEGKKFSSFINKKAQSLVKELKKSHKAITRNNKNFGGFDDEKRKTFCTDINYFEDLFEDFTTVTRQGHDFIKINSRYFSRKINKRAWNRYFKRKFWAEKYLHDNYYSLIKAEEERKKIEKEMKETEKEKEKDWVDAKLKKVKNSFWKSELGRHLLNRELYEFKLKEILEIQEKRCKA